MKQFSDAAAVYGARKLLEHVVLPTGEVVVLADAQVIVGEDETLVTVCLAVRTSHLREWAGEEC